MDAETVDDVVIINNGRLVKAGTMADLHGTPGALVRTSDPNRLAGALRVSDVTSTLAEDGETLVAETSDLRLIGDVALRAGLPIWGLSPKQADLEDLFFRLTSAPEHRNRNLGAPPPGDGLPPAPATSQDGGSI